MMITVTNQRVGDHRDSILSPFLLHFFGLSVLPHLSGAAMKNRTRGRIVATQHKHQSRFSPTTFKQGKIIWVHLHHISPTDYFLLQRLFLQTEQTLLRASHTHTHSVSATVITAQHRHLFQFFFFCTKSSKLQKRGRTFLMWLQWRSSPLRAAVHSIWSWSIGASIKSYTFLPSKKCGCELWAQLVTLSECANGW